MFHRKKNGKEDQNTIIIECSCFDDAHQLNIWYDKDYKSIYFRTKMIATNGEAYNKNSNLPDIIYDIKWKTLRIIEYVSRLWKAIINKPSWDIAEILIEPTEAHELVKFITSKVGDGTDDLGDAGKI